MEQFKQMFNIQLTQLVYLILGWLTYRLKIITDENRSSFISLILNVLMPIMVFNSFKAVTVTMLKVGIQALIASTIIYTLIYLLGGKIFMNYSNKDQRLLHYALLANNAGLGGQPLSQLMYGDYGGVLAAIYLLPHRIYMWTAGIEILTGKEQKRSFRSIWNRVISNPSIVAIFLGLIRGLLQIPLPASIDRAFGAVSGMVSPLAMITIGSILATVNFKKLLNKAVVHFTVVRLLLIPACVLVVVRLLKLDPTLSGVLVIMSTMPAGSTTALLADQYDLDSELASKITFVTTLLSIITVPFMLLFI